MASGYELYLTSNTSEGEMRCDCLSACWEPTPLQLRQQDNPNRSVEVGGDGE